MRRLIAVLALTLAAPAGAAERVVQVADFTRLRVEAPVEVVVTRGPPRATVVGDPRAAEWLDVRGEGGTVTVRLKPGGPVATTPLRVALSAPALASVIAGGGARVTVGGLKATRVDLVLAGSGSLAVSAIDAGQLSLLVAGNGSATLAGRAAAARMVVSGAGAVDADALVADALTLSSHGAGETRARARYTATVANSGAGQVTVAGTPTCVIRSGSRGPVSCGAAAR